MAKNRCQKVPKSNFQSWSSTSKIHRIFLKKCFVEKYQFRSNFFVLSILCSIKIERLLFLKFLKIWLFFTAIFGHLTRLMNKSLPFLWSVQSWLQSEMFFIKFRWHDEKLTVDVSSYDQYPWWNLIWIGFKKWFVIGQLNGFWPLSFSLNRI